MPTAPYALVRASLNGGAIQTGGITATGGETCQLSAEPAGLAGAVQVRWEILDCPDAFTEPAGWSTDANGVFYSTAATPPVFSLLPNSDWGKYIFRLTLNGGGPAITTRTTAAQLEAIALLVDDTTAVSVPSVDGFKDTAYYESNQFGGTKGWVKEHKENLRTIQSLITAAGVGVAEVAAPALVATSNIALTGTVTVDGVASNTVSGDILATAQTSSSQNGYWTPGSGAWTRPSYYNSDALVAAVLGVATPAVVGGTLGAGSVWAQREGASLAGAKTWVKLPDAADKAVVTCLLPSGDTSGVTDAAVINAALAKVKAAGAGTVQLAATGPWYVNDDLVCEETQGVYLIGSGGGATGPTSGTRLIRVPNATTPANFNTGHRAFTQPSVGATVTVTVDDTTNMRVGKRARTRSGPAVGQTYVITAIGSGTVTLRNDGATGNAAPTTALAADFLRSDDAVIQMRSDFACGVRDLQIQAASPTFCGKAVNFDGSPYGSDGAHNDAWDCTIITAAFSALPVLVALDTTTHPAATLTGACAQCLDLLVEMLSSTTYRYSTDGGRTWDESSDTSPITITASRAFPSASNAYGLTLNLPGTYATGYKYRAQQGIQRGVDLQNCFDCDTWVRFDTVLDGVYASGLSNTITGTGLGVDGYLVTLSGAGANTVDVSSEPGGRGYGRGGVWSDSGVANRIALAAGDQLTGGSWIWLQSEASPLLQCSLTQAAGAAISMLGCANVRIRGSFSGTPSYVFDVSRTGTATLGVSVEDVNGFTWDGVTNTLFTGANVGYVSYAKDSQRSISSAYLINAAASYNGLVNGPGTQALVNACLNTGGQRSAALAWGTTSGATIEILTAAHGYGEGIGHFSRQNVPGAGHSFLVRDSAATNGQRVQHRVSQLGVCHVGTAITLANGANDNVAIKSSYVEAAGPTGAFSISGFVPDSDFKDGQLLRLVWTVEQALTIKHDATSTAANRTVTPTAADVVCAAPGAGGYGFAEFQYSLAASRWRLLSHT
jgi:hypothetical protein